MTLRLVDATTESYFPSGKLVGVVDNLGIPWFNHLDGGDGEGAVPEDRHKSRRLTLFGDGTHGTSGGTGMCTRGEFHMFGGSYVILTLLDAWEYL